MKFIKKYDTFKNNNYLLSEDTECISENLKYHIDNNISLLDNIFRIGSESYYSLIEESRSLFDKGLLNNISLDDLYLLENTDIGTFGLYEGIKVPLDYPILEAEYKGREVDLNYPVRSEGPKKFKVYVKDPKTGNIKKVNFGDVKGGLKAKLSDPKARKSFSARHNCKDKKDKTKPGYWSCRLNRYSHLNSLKKTYPGFW